MNNCPYGCGDPNCKVTLQGVINMSKKPKEVKQQVVVRKEVTK